MTETEKRQLLEKARAARKYAYAPYSQFAVGAAVLTDDGSMFDGCNVENASYGATICAERVAIFKALSAGKKKLHAIAIMADYPKPLPPCGICRQVLIEFSEPDARVIMSNTTGEISEKTVDELLPLSFQFPGPVSK